MASSSAHDTRYKSQVLQQQTDEKASHHHHHQKRKKKNKVQIVDDDVVAATTTAVDHDPRLARKSASYSAHHRELEALDRILTAANEEDLKVEEEEEDGRRAPEPTSLTTSGTTSSHHLGQSAEGRPAKRHRHRCHKHRKIQKTEQRQ